MYNSVSQPNFVDPLFGKNMNNNDLTSIQKDLITSIHYTLKQDNGDLLDSSQDQEPLTFLVGHGNIIQALETALIGKKIGDKFDVNIEAKDAYGERQEEAIQQVPMTAFEEVDDLEIGMRFHLQTEMGPTPIIVTAIEDGTVTVDPHHPFAGKNLIFSVSVVDIRAASAEELRSNGSSEND